MPGLTRLAARGPLFTAARVPRAGVETSAGFIFLCGGMGVFVFGEAPKVPAVAMAKKKSARRVFFCGLRRLLERFHRSAIQRAGCPKVNMSRGSQAYFGVAFVKTCGWSF